MLPFHVISPTPQPRGEKVKKDFSIHTHRCTIYALYCSEEMNNMAFIKINELNLIWVFFILCIASLFVKCTININNVDVAAGSCIIL